MTFFLSLVPVLLGWLLGFIKPKAPDAAQEVAKTDGRMLKDAVDRPDDSAAAKRLRDGTA